MRSTKITRNRPGALGGYVPSRQIGAMRPGSSPSSLVRVGSFGFPSIRRILARYLYDQIAGATVDEMAHAWPMKERVGMDGTWALFQFLSRVSGTRSR